jgi:3-oxoadipate enol-lactonase
MQPSNPLPAAPPSSQHKGITMRIPVYGASLFARVDGDDRPDKPWLVLSNSLASDHTMWDGQIALLTKKFRVLRYDTRGHGQSDAPAGAYSFPMLVADVIALLDHIKIAKAHYMGLSLGGMTGIGLALAHPSRLEKLVCCDARADGPEGFVKSWDERLAAIEKGGLEAIVGGTLERWLVQSFRDASPDTTARIRAMILATPPSGYKGCAEALKRLDYLKDMNRIITPSLFVVGREDLGAPVAAMQDMAARVPGAKLAIIDNAAHLPNVDNAKAFNAAIAPFLGLTSAA